MFVDNYLLKSYEILLTNETIDKEFINTIIKKINLTGE